jgi:ketosteroid isomerase-like protein
MLLSWLAKKLLSYTMGRTRAGDIRPQLLLYAPDISFTFPGDNSWSGTYKGKPEVERWLRRFARVGIQAFPDEVIATGLPWNTTVCIRAHDYLRSPQGETVYENRFVIWARLRWGRVKQYEVYEDTIKPRALDDYLARTEPSLLAA